MYELSLAHLNVTDRERDIDADLRQRQILKAATAQTAPTTPATAVESRALATPVGRRLSTNLRSTER